MVKQGASAPCSKHKGVKVDINKSLYAQLCRDDLIHLMRPATIPKGLYMPRDSDGKLEAREVGMGMDSPWHHVKNDPRLKCDIWHQITFDIISKNTPTRFVPMYCQQCWKVVVRPRTVVELFQLLNLQEQLDYPSKCGIEPRDTVPAHYGGYFYNWGQPAGLEKFKIVREAISDVISPDISVILKRACTEFEIACGPSNKWVVYNWQIPIEQMIEEGVARDGIERTQPAMVLTHVHRKWIEWAHEQGDMTYLELSEERMYPESVTYHHLVGKSDEEIEAFTKGQSE